jgi:hypothetical protein
LTSTLISWSTFSERNNHIFLVEHSANGLDFKTIGEVKGARNSSQIINYSFEHHSPTRGINYYRLKQIDFDGKILYSAIKWVDLKTSADILQTTIVKDIIEIRTNENQEANLSFFNNSGQKMMEVKGTGKQFINVASFPAGVYFVTTSEGNRFKFLKF